MDIFYVAILFTLLPLGGSAPKVSIDSSAEAVAEREIYRHFAMLDSIDLLFTNSQGVGSEIILRIGILRNIIIYSIVTSYLYSRLKICGSELPWKYIFTSWNANFRLEPQATEFLTIVGFSVRFRSYGDFVFAHNDNFFFRKCGK